MEQKNITIVKPGAGEDGQSDAYDVTISAGMTAKQVLDQIGLQGDYSLTKGDGRTIAPSDDLFPKVDSGDKVFATTAATFGLLAP